MINALVARKYNCLLQVKLCISTVLLETRKLSYCLVSSLNFVKVTRSQRKDVLLALQMSAVRSSVSLIQVAGQCQLLCCLSSTEPLQKPLGLMPLEASQKSVWIPEGCTRFGSGANRSSATIPVQSQAEERQMVPEGGQ